MSGLLLHPERRSGPRRQREQQCPKLEDARYTAPPFRSAARQRALPQGSGDSMPTAALVRSQPRRSAPAAHPAQGRMILAGIVGNVMEWYDFAVYGYFAPIIGRQFFPSEDPTA